MSQARRARERNAASASKKETYSRADEALWDDEYLLKLFNEQLENSNAVSETAKRSGSDVSSASSEESEETASKSSAASEEERRKTVVAQTPVTASTMFASSAGGQVGQQLPADIQQLVQSFYSAGFEAGRYVGRAEAATQASRKRQR